jgi:CheY-like chemotaxis protein
MGKKILIVEDDPIARRSMERLICSDARLAAFEPFVVQAASGQQGLAVFVSERPDLIITDLYMPAMDGFAFCRALREAPFGKDVPIIVMSGIYKDPALASSLSDEVQAHFLPKPLQSDDLMHLILKCFGQVPTGQADDDASLPIMQELPEDLPVPVATANTKHSSETRSIALDLSDLPPPPDTLVDRHASAPAIYTTGRNAEGALIGSGSLQEKHIAGLIFDLADTTTTGTLALAHGKMRKDLYVRNGQVVAADSNLRQEALGTLLCAKGIIDESQLTYLLAETKKRGQKMGAVLVEIGWMSPEEVLQCLAAQARKRIIECLRWDEGTYTFTPGDTFGERILEHDLDVAKSVFLGLFRSATPESLVQRFDQSGACPVQLTQRFDRYKEQFEGIFGGDISHVITEAPSLGSLALREDAHMVMAELDALIETGLAVIGAQTEESALLLSPAESSFSLEKLGAELNKRFDAIVQNPTDMSFTEMRKSDVLPMVTSTGYSEMADDSTSGALDIGYRAITDLQTDTQVPQTSSEDLRQRLLHEYLMIHGKSHYEILAVTPQTPTDQIEEALRTRLEAYSDEAIAGIELSASDKARLDAVRAAIVQAGRVLCAPAARTDYDQTLVTVKKEYIDPLGAELSFGEALQLFQSDQIDGALAKFKAAVSARPDQALYHAYLGWADFLAHGPEKTADARERLEHALVLDPELALAHAMLGRLAATQDDAKTARHHLEQSLVIDPEQPETVSLLLEAYTRLPEPDPHGAERFLRKLVMALGDHAEPLRKRLWLELGDLYENKLSDRSSARIAYDTAARLAPKNIDIVRKSLELNAEDPSRWRETAHALSAEWQLHPHEAAPATKLLTLFQQQGQKEGVAMAAAAMVLRGLADDSVQKIAEEGRPGSLHQIPGPLPADLLSRVGYRSEESDLEALAALLVETSVLKPFTRDELGLMESDVPVPISAQPERFRKILEYVCNLYQVAAPQEVINMPVLGGDARMADLRPPALLCGHLLLEAEDTVELGFRLSRAMALCAPGRLAGSARSGGQMRPYFIAALAFANAAGPLQGSSAMEAAKAISELDGESRARLLSAAQTIKQKYDNLNLSVWGRGLARVATRLALLISGDLLRVGRAVAEEEGPSALDDILAFALSLDYLDLRHALGLALP